VQAAQERNIIVVTLTGRNGGRLRDEVQLMGEQESA
jgi:phosphoheptose isomerase